ncbi:winged helix-turn-helix domain-containing protein [Vibrio gigantis]|uniref:winged helix-turn-helix domain-containing protein n=1 Tax=Vibrio gigantis TaxID=296199 RepID=UPI001BFD0713|nr:winged helix-turn-helix domain-containing protein [Vibrio gigantis]
MQKERIQYSFDVWLFIPDEDKLIMNEEDVIIDNRLSKLLDFFCQNPNIVFSRDELINEVWNGSILTDQVITQAIFELRKTLKSAERHSMGYIITVPKRGYKLDVEVQKTILIHPSMVTKTLPVSDVYENTEQPESAPTSDSSIKTQQDSPQPINGAAVIVDQPINHDEVEDSKAPHEQVPQAHTQHQTETKNHRDNTQNDQTPLSNTHPNRDEASSKTRDSNDLTNGPDQPSANYAKSTATRNDTTTKPERTQRKPYRLAIVVSAIVIAIGVFWWWLQSPNESYNSIDSSTLVTTERAYSRNHASDSDAKSNAVTNHQIIEEHKAHATVHYLSLEPRYIYVRVDENLKNNAFMRGIVHKLMSYVTTYRNFRIIVDETLVPNSANVVSFKSKTEGDREYLDITYFNRISNFKHLGRDYLIDASSLHSTMRTMLDDLLDSFNIDIQKTILKQQISELPKQEVPLRLALESLGLTFMTLDRTDTLKKIIEANELEPDNHFLMSSRYLYELADIFLLKSSQKEKLVQKLNDRFGKKLLLAENSPTSYRVYDALAAYSLTQDNPNEAERYMTLIPRNDYNVMSMIILAKLEESKGNPAAAEEFYYETILESGYPVVLKIAQTLFFNSNISEIESKLERVD